MNMESKKYPKNGYKKTYQNNRDLPPIIKSKSCMRQLYQQKKKGCFYLCHLSKNS